MISRARVRSLRAGLVAAGAVVHRRRVGQPDLGGVAARARRVIGPRELAVADVAVGAGDVEADAALHPRRRRGACLCENRDGSVCHASSTGYGLSGAASGLVVTLVWQTWQNGPGVAEELLAVARAVVARLVIVAARAARRCGGTRCTGSARGARATAALGSIGGSGASSWRGGEHAATSTTHAIRQLRAHLPRADAITARVEGRQPAGQGVVAIARVQMRPGRRQRALRDDPPRRARPAATRSPRSRALRGACRPR